MFDQREKHGKFVAKIFVVWQDIEKQISGMFASVMFIHYPAPQKNGKDNNLIY